MAPAIPPAQMAMLLADIHLAEVSIRLSPIAPDSMEYYYFSAYNDVLQKQGITPGVFMESFEYYMKTPGTLEKIYEETLDRLGEMSAGK